MDGIFLLLKEYYVQGNKNNGLGFSDQIHTVRNQLCNESASNHIFCNLKINELKVSFSLTVENVFVISFHHCMFHTGYLLKDIVQQRILRGVNTKLKKPVLVNWRPAHFSFEF